MPEEIQPQEEPARDESQLDEEDLDSVAGGGRWTCVDPIICDPIIQPIDPLPLPLPLSEDIL